MKGLLRQYGSHVFNIESNDYISNVSLSPFEESLYIALHALSHVPCQEVNEKGSNS